MNIILLSGGSGKRLWPLSNDTRSKQFIKIFKKPDGTRESMIQRVYRQIKAADPGADITVAAGRAQVSAVHNQIGMDAAVSVEPCRRDTFPAVALASAYLADVKGIDPSEAVVVCPVDPYVGEDYFEALKELSARAGRCGSNLVLMGIEPAYPSEKYGYIIPKDGGTVSEVLMFKEKPDIHAAERYIKSGALWNGGVFAYRLRYVLDRAKEAAGSCSHRDLLDNYRRLPGISFDYAVAEQEPSVQVMRFGGMWKDIGTWNTFTEAMDEDIVGSGRMDRTCADVHILNELDIPVIAMGLRGVVISASPEGILVSDKEQSSYIKPFVEELDQPVRYAEKSWGSYRVIDAGSRSLTVKVALKPGHSMNYHSHERRDEVWTVISGRGRTVVDGKEQLVKTGDVVAMGAGCRHTVFAETELELIEVQLGKDISAADKHKYELEV